MREIKWKVYSKEGKQVIFRLDEIININHESLTDDEYIFITASDYLQFTGLIDKHGKDIYEGDIIRYGDTYGTVRWSTDDARFYISAPAQNTEFNNAIWNLNIRWELMEIIGNIYTNSELLKANIGGTK